MESRKVSCERRSRMGDSRSPTSAWRVKATFWSTSITSSRNNSARRRRMTTSSRTRMGQSLGWRRASSEGPASRWTSARRVSNGNSPVSPGYRLPGVGGGIKSPSGELMHSLPQEIDGGNARAAALGVHSQPFDVFAAIAAQSVARAQRHVANHAAEPLRGRELHEYVADGSLRMRLQYGANIGLERAKIDLRLRHQISHIREIDERRVAIHHAAAGRLSGGVEERPLRHRTQAAAAQFERECQRFGGLDLVLEGQRCALPIAQHLIDAPLLQVFAALHEILEAARQPLQNFVDHAALVEQRAREAQQEAAVAGIQSAGEFAREDALGGLVQSGRLYGIGEQPPKCREGAAGLAIGNEVGAGEERFEN